MKLPRIDALDLRRVQVHVPNRQEWAEANRSIIPLDADYDSFEWDWPEFPPFVTLFIESGWRPTGDAKFSWR